MENVIAIDPRVNSTESGQYVTEYIRKFNGKKLRCGVTYFKCGNAPIVILSDTDACVSITNSIEDAANKVRLDKFDSYPAGRLIFFEHYRRIDDDGRDSFFQVKMKWDDRLESYVNPEWTEISPSKLKHLLSCYGYAKHSLPDMSFVSAAILQFRSGYAR